MTPKQSLESFGLVDKNGEVHSYPSELTPAFEQYAQALANEHLALQKAKHDKFIEWMDRKLLLAYKIFHDMSNSADIRHHAYGRINAFTESKEKYLSL